MNDIQVVGDIHGQCCDLLNVLEFTKGEDMIWSSQTPRGGEQVSVGRDTAATLSHPLCPLYRLILSCL